MPYAATIRTPALGRSSRFSQFEEASHHVVPTIFGVGASAKESQSWSGVDDQDSRPVCFGMICCFLLFTFSSTQTGALQLPSIPRTHHIYAQRMTEKGRGTPIWRPGPSNTLPEVYRRRGTAVGDVGILTVSGSFDFFFNICLPASHPINQQGLPQGFSPLFPPLQSSDIHRHMEFNRNSYLLSASVKRSHEENDASYDHLFFDICPKLIHLDAEE